MTAEYIRRHNPVWPELEDILKAHGVLSYSIFLNETSEDFFGYLEITDEELFGRLSANEVMKRWWKHMTEVLVTDDPQGNKANEVLLKEVFYLA